MARPFHYLLALRAGGRTTVALGLLALTGCSNRTWQGVLYPDREDLTYWIELGTFQDLGACKASAKMILGQLQIARSFTTEEEPPPEGTYECGRGCKPLNEYGIRICDETVDE